MTPANRLLVCSIQIVVVIGFLVHCGEATAQTPRWSDKGGGDCGGRDVDCSVGSQPEGSKCSSSVLGRTAVCWERGANRGYPSFAGCRGNPDDWCTHKNVAADQCVGGG